MNYISVCMNFRDEGPYLKEWIDYHLLIGVDHFYLFNNNSTDNFLEVLRPYIDKKIVSLHYIKDSPAKPKMYNHCVTAYNKNNNWLAFIDSDEFIVPTSKDSIKELMEEYEEYPALGINWKMFGSSNLKQKPSGLVIQNYVYRQDETSESYDNLCYHIKSIINPSKVIQQFINPHYFLYDPGKCFPYIPAAVDSNKNVIDGKNHKSKKPNFSAFTNSINYDKVSINHYWCKSEEEYFNRKVKKPMDDANIERDQSIKMFEDFNKKSNKIYDDTALRFAKKLNGENE